MRKKLLALRWLAIVAVLTGLFFACRKDYKNEEDIQAQLADPTVALSVKAARTYFATLIAKEGETVADPDSAKGLKAMSANSSKKPVNKKYVMFSKAWEGQTSDVSFVEAPLHYNKRPSNVFQTKEAALDVEKYTQLLNSSFDRLVIFKDKKTGEIDQRIITFMPDMAYLEKHHNDASGNKINHLDNDFSGYLMYKTWGGKLLSVLRIKNGKGVRRFLPGIGSGIARQDTTGKKVSNVKVLAIVCEPVYNFYYQQTCTYSDPERTQDQYCTDWQLTGSEPAGYDTCYDDGTGNTGYNPCNDPSNFSSSCTTSQPCQTCGGGGNGGGGSGNFGLDGNNCVNCRIQDNNFDNYLDYQRNVLGLSVGNPFNTTLTVNGVTYTGQMTELYDSNGQIRAAFFSPDATAGPFYTGIEYSIGSGVNTNYTSQNGNYGNIGYGSTLSSINYGNPVYYTPTSGGGGPFSSPIAREAQELADDNRVINEIQQEDAQDDAASSPCHGTGRNGNVSWNGVVEHWVIQTDYLESNSGAYKEYYVPGSSSRLNGGPGYADIVNTSTSEMFEIKSALGNGPSTGAAEIQIYVDQANALCPAQNGTPWHGGTNYSQRTLIDFKNPNNVIVSQLYSSGVIVYTRQPRNGAPSPSPVVLPQDLADKLKTFLRQVALNPNNMTKQMETFLRNNPRIYNSLKGIAVSIVIGTIIEDIVTEGIGVADDWQSFLIARTLWRVSNKLILY